MKWKNIAVLSLVLSLVLILLASLTLAQEDFNKDKKFETKDIEQGNTINLHMFYGQGCPHCAKLRIFLEDIKKEYPTLIIFEHEVYQDQEERELFTQMAKNYGEEISGVPTVFISDKIISGFSDKIGEEIKLEIETCLAKECKNPINKKSEDKQETKETINKLTIPIVISAAAVDAINPCAFAVLIILMSAALSIANKKRALKFGLAFTISIYISYFLIGLGIFSALQAAKISHGFYIFITALAVIVGILNIKDYFWYGKGFLMEIPLSWRPAMKKLLNGATSPFGAFLVGFLVSLFELPCTGGPYIVILGLLAKEVSRNVGILYLLLYNLVFVLPLIILSIIIYKGLSSTEKLEKIRQQKIRVLHLIAGILMLGIAVVMIMSIIKGWV